MYNLQQPTMAPLNYCHGLGAMTPRLRTTGVRERGGGVGGVRLCVKVVVVQCATRIGAHKVIRTCQNKGSY